MQHLARSLWRSKSSSTAAMALQTTPATSARSAAQGVSDDDEDLETPTLEEPP